MIQDDNQWQPIESYEPDYGPSRLGLTILTLGIVGIFLVVLW